MLRKGRLTVFSTGLKIKHFTLKKTVSRHHRNRKQQLDTAAFTSSVSHSKLLPIETRAAQSWTCCRAFPLYSHQEPEPDAAAHSGQLCQRLVYTLLSELQGAGTSLALVTQSVFCSIMILQEPGHTTAWSTSRPCATAQKTHRSWLRFL